MTDQTSDDSRLRATEQQMRRALGLGGGGSNHNPSPSPTARPPRRFARDGEVSVTVLHRDRDDGGSKLESARRSLQEQMALREQTEHQLRDAKATIHDLQTKLGHEQIARDEATRHAEQQLTALRQELEKERAHRLKLEVELAEGIASKAKPSRETADLGPHTRSRHDQPPKSGQDEPKAVEWWVPGWEKRLRSAL